MHEKRHFLSYRKRRHDAQIMCSYAYYVTLGSRCKMVNSSSEDETDISSERPTRIQPYQFEPVRQDFEEYLKIVSAAELPEQAVSTLDWRSQRQQQERWHWHCRVDGGGAESSSFLHRRECCVL